MTITFGTNENNDLYLDAAGNLVVLTALDAVIAACKTASQAQLGEMVLETGQGIPNFQSVWVGSPNYNLWVSYLNNTLGNVSGVIAVTSIQLQQNGDTLQYVATIESQYGQAEINSTIIVS